MLKKENETPNAVAFSVEIPRNTSSERPAVVKRLEQESDAAAPITHDMIEQKL